MFNYVKIYIHMYMNATARIHIENDVSKIIHIQRGVR